MGCIRKALEKGVFGTLGLHAVLTICLRISSILDNVCVCSLLPLFVNKQRPCPHANSPHGLLLPVMHHESLWFAKGLALGV